MVKREAGHPPREGDLGGRRGESQQQELLYASFPRRRPSISPPHHARCQLVDAMMSPTPRRPNTSIAKVVMLWPCSSKRNLEPLGHTDQIDRDLLL